MNEFGIVPYQRIEELDCFYTSNSVKFERAIEVVDVKNKKKLSEEVQGQWVLEQVEAVLDVLRVKAFVIPSDKGGCEIPCIPARDEYITAHLNSKMRGLWR